MTRTVAMAVSLVAVLVGFAPTPLLAQSALDGFNPGANSTVSALAVQPDGQILVGGTSRPWAAAGPARRRVTTSGGSTPTDRSTWISIRARTQP